MTTGITPNSHGGLMGSRSILVMLGVLSLGLYWAWIFTCFSSAVMNPFGTPHISDYLLFLVIAAGISAVSMCAAAFMPASFEGFLRSVLGSVLVGLAAACSGLPALLGQTPHPLSFNLAIAFWAVGMFASSFVLLKTAPFLVWLKRVKLSRCIGIGFLIAAVCYMLAQLLLIRAAIVAVMLFPLVSTACSQAAEAIMRGPAAPEQAQPTHRISLKMRLSELVPYMPITLIYSISFGFISCIVLKLAVANHLVIFMALSILLSAVFTVCYTFMAKESFDAERFRHFLLPLIAVALLPFPYLPVTFQVVFLSVAIFGFTCFDAVGWGDVADEIRDRGLEQFSYAATAQSIGFIGIFIGWGTGLFVVNTFASSLERAFGIISLVLVIALILELVISDRANRPEAVADPSVLEDDWEGRCHTIAAAHGLTAQETRIFMMLARGRNLRYVAEELVISGHTVKTHIYHIYKKLDIHSQQELIDMVDTALKQ